MHMAWAARFNAKDVDGMLEFFEPPETAGCMWPA